MDSIHVERGDRGGQPMEVPRDLEEVLPREASLSSRGAVGRTRVRLLSWVSEFDEEHRPPVELTTTLEAAALGGVEVHVLPPGNSDYAIL